jgi:hypothetical protein
MNKIQNNRHRAGCSFNTCGTIPETPKINNVIDTSVKDIENVRLYLTLINPSCDVLSLFSILP